MGGPIKIRGFQRRGGSVFIIGGMDDGLHRGGGFFQEGTAGWTRVNRLPTQ